MVPVVEKLPVGFNLYPLPSLSQDDRLLIRVLKSNERHKTLKNYHNAQLSIFVRFQLKV